MNSFKEVAARVKQIEEAQKRFDRELVTKCDWEDPEDVSAYRKGLRQSQRNILLDRLVPNRMCFVCEIIFAESSRWIVTKDQSRAVCRSCYYASKSRVKDISSIGRIFPRSTVEVRYDIDGDNLMVIREEMGLARKQFAILAGWSYSYQTKLENGEIVTVSPVTVEKVFAVINGVWRR